jgi:hypothetical protein
MFESDGRTFVDACLAGIAFADDVDDWVDQWHDAGGVFNGESVALRELLGMSADEYGLWVEQPSALEFIVASHKRGTPVTELMTSRDSYALAARSADPEATQDVLMWLVQTGRIDPESASRA